MTDLRTDLPPIPRTVWLASGVMALGGFLGNMDASIVAVGLESMRHSLGVELVAIQWVATAYLLGLSAALPLTPWLGRKYGAGRLWLGALTAFLLTSVACALAPDAGTLIGFRAVQGMAAGVMVTAGQTVIGLAVGPERLGRTMGTLALAVGLAPVVGPSVGGFLLAHFSWPVLFWLNLPIGLLAFGLALRYVPRGDRQQPPPMDWRGLAMVSLGLPLLVYALTELGTPGSLTIALAAVGAAAMGLFTWWSLRMPHPVLQLRLAARPVMGSALAAVLLGGAGMFGAVLLLPLWFQIRLGAGTAESGVLLAPMGLATAVFVFVAGRLTDRHGGGTVALTGSLVVLASTVPLPWLGPDSPMWLVQALLLVRGAGLGLSVIPASTAAYASVDAAELGHATALVNIVLRVGGALGGALCVIVLSQGLHTGPATGFGWAFGVLAVLCVLSTATATWVRRAERLSAMDRKA
ncbi:drug resistance transporter, EmrB/QacA subfamily [Amycolatopsis tolypomycina]|uniref:Drug resistance transporter, EmrB/QacA subfamily n=1 Tax=Amycolatopsis tolypomycina TaxID=208445 RepID=A0A1H5B5N8_9PSEU|nr:MDR family MFS transporter [Amycolatopsis tolypomycina]SED49893.1 drug resistance transporter, EmrB/QacA subfamily [Amycolatopsis tolypomycina]